MLCERLLDKCQRERQEIRKLVNAEIKFLRTLILLKNFVNKTNHKNKQNKL